MQQNELAGIPENVWQSIAERLRSVGVFADESRDFVPGQVARPLLVKIENKVREYSYSGGQLNIETLPETIDGVTFLIFDSARFNDVAAAETAWRSDYSNRWHRRVLDRVTDWQRRLDDLRSKIQEWIASSGITGLSIVNRSPITMHEELMRRFRVPPTELASYEIVRDGKRLMRIQPKGLWVLGANGRVDITTKNASLMLVDESEPMSSSPDWKVYQSSDRRNAVPLSQDNFLDLLRQMAA